MWKLFLISFLITKIEGISQLCFIRVESTVRRDSLGVVPAISQFTCNIRCVDTPGCDACMFYEDRGMCVLLTKARSPPPGQCPTTYTCYERRTSGCPVRSGPSIDRGYTPGPCSRLSDVRGPPLIGQNRICGSPANPADRRLVLDAILHDGTRTIFENDKSSLVQWDDKMGSWVYILHNAPYYFKSATCVHVPTTPLAPECDCAPIPTYQQIVPGRTKHPSAQPSIQTEPICTTIVVQMYAKRTRSANGDDQIVHETAGHYLYCAMGEWMDLDNTTVPNYNEYIVIAATCVI